MYTCLEICNMQIAHAQINMQHSTHATTATKLLYYTCVQHQHRMSYSCIIDTRYTCIQIQHLGMSFTAYIMHHKCIEFKFTSHIIRCTCHARVTRANFKHQSKSRMRNISVPYMHVRIMLHYIHLLACRYCTFAYNSSKWHMLKCLHANSIQCKCMSDVQSISAQRIIIHLGYRAFPSPLLHAY